MVAKRAGSGNVDSYRNTICVLHFRTSGAITLGITGIKPSVRQVSFPACLGVLAGEADQNVLVIIRIQVLDRVVKVCRSSVILSLVEESPLARE